MLSHERIEAQVDTTCKFDAGKTENDLRISIGFLKSSESFGDAPRRSNSVDTAFSSSPKLSQVCQLDRDMDKKGDHSFNSTIKIQILSARAFVMPINSL